MRVFFAPHADDETLFGAFTILRHRPLVVICFPSERDYGETEARLAESRAAVRILGGTDVDQWPGGDVAERMRRLDALGRPERVWAPDPAASHRDHVAVAAAAREVFGDRLETYHTYVGGERVRSDRLAPVEPLWVEKKLRALACYRTQLEHPRARRFFLQEQHEYLGQEARL